MNSDLLPYPEQEKCCSERKPDMRQALVEKRELMAKRLKDVDDAIAAMDENPKLTKMLELLGRASRY